MPKLNFLDRLLNHRLRHYDLQQQQRPSSTTSMISPPVINVAHPGNGDKNHVLACSAPSPQHSSAPRVFAAGPTQQKIEKVKKRESGGVVVQPRLQPRSSLHNYSPSARQDYHRLKKHCLQRRQLFVDITFPPTNASLFLSTSVPNTYNSSELDIVWKRPGELVDDPKLFVEGASPNDVTQGILGNCWFVSACSALTHNEYLLARVIPDAARQEWDEGNHYCGIFQFQFWNFGRWVEVIIDDLLPTKDGKLLFARSKTPNEFWSALLEKAFAKLYGCYENLVGGQLADALQDVSGGVAESITVRKHLDAGLRDPDGRLFQLLRRAFNQKALIVAAIAAKREEIEQSLDCGLVKGHAYAVTAVRYVELDASTAAESDAENPDTVGNKPPNRRQMMIRLQNPWGEKEWDGPWSDGSAEWDLVSEQQKCLLGVTLCDDGDFWMPWEDFCRYFTDVSVCQLFNTCAESGAFGSGISPTQQLHSSEVIFACASNSNGKVAGESEENRRYGYDNEDIATEQPSFYHEYLFYDRWSTNGVKSGAPRDRAGGCQNFVATFCFNPQYLFDIPPPKPPPAIMGYINHNNNNDPVDGSNNGEVMIALTQKEVWLPDETGPNSKLREPFVTMGVHVMRVENNREHRIHQSINPVATSDYASTRSLFMHITGLAPGRYILMPTTYAPRERADFLLRVYSPQELRMRALTEDSPGMGVLRSGTTGLGAWRLLIGNCGRRGAGSVTRVRVQSIALGGAACWNTEICSSIYVVVIPAEGRKTRTAAHSIEKAQEAANGASEGKPTVALLPSPLEVDELFLFHSPSLRHRFVFELWEVGVGTKSRQRGVGRCVARTSPLAIVTDNDTTSHELALNPTLMARMLMDSAGSKDEKRAGGQGTSQHEPVGKLLLEVSSYDDLMYL